MRRYDGPVDARWFGLVPGSDENQTAKLQRAIDSVYQSGKTETVSIPTGEYLVANLLVRDGVSIEGAGIGETTLRLYDPLYVRQHPTNSVAGPTRPDHKGEYAANVLTTHLHWNGGVATKPADRERTRDPEDTDWDVSDLSIRNLTLDGNWFGGYPTDKTGAPLSNENGQNNSDCGACLRIVNAGHVTVENVEALNARHDGLYAGFDLNGGFDYGTVRNVRTENCARTGVAQIAGRGSTFKNLDLRCGDEGTMSVAAFDIEANLPEIVNKGHVVEDVYAEGALKNVCRADARQHDVVFRNCRATHCVVGQSSTVGGTLFLDCNFEYGEGKRPAIGMNGYGSIDTETDFGKRKIVFFDCTFSGNYTHSVWSRVSVGQLLLYGCRFEAENGIRLTFPYEIVVRNTEFRLGTNADYAFRFVFAFSDKVRVQGQIRIVDCTVHGDVDNVVQFVKGHRPPTLSERDLTVESVRHVGKIRENGIRSGYRLSAKNNSWNEAEN
ncbi:glycoside hydrolase family 55 protein [Salinibacter sp.]|uniref:glycoside hydrolase family 55 protein n=1 Tax=Salinibacter sp. TaxID=2065818 RepID=UPI0021E92F79|nr:glycoside hydrolase family 55 protein [Salinibacter sp.]